MTSGFSKHGLNRLRDTMIGYVDRGEVPGLVALLSRGGETHVEAIGHQAIGGDAVGRETLFRIASMTKSVVAAAAMILVEDCKIRLDDPVGKWLPELADMKVLRDGLESEVEDTVPANRQMTLRDILTFRLGCGVVMARPGTYPIQRAALKAGLPQGPPDPQAYPEPDEWLRRFATLPLVYQPGERWLYHTGSDLLGVLIARVSGVSLDEFLLERIFRPLRMADTSFSVSSEKMHRFASAYRPKPDGGLDLMDAADGGRWSKPPAFPSGGGGLVSNVDDFLIFAQMLINGGSVDGTRILSRASVELMTLDHLTEAQKRVSGFWPGFFDDIGWGFGVSVVTRKSDVPFSVGTYGWDGGLGTSWRNDPKEGLIGIILTQRSFTSPLPPDPIRDFWTMAYQTLDE